MKAAVESAVRNEVPTQSEARGSGEGGQEVKRMGKSKRKKKKKKNIQAIPSWFKKKKTWAIEL